jgi:hypothetical protein
MWVVYGHPRDFPEHFVARVFRFESDGGEYRQVSFIGQTRGTGCCTVSQGKKGNT